MLDSEQFGTPIVVGAGTDSTVVEPGDGPQLIVDIVGEMKLLTAPWTMAPMVADTGIVRMWALHVDTRGAPLGPHSFSLATGPLLSYPF